MHKSDIDGENTGTDANQAGVLSRSAASASQIIPFPQSRAASGSAAAGDPRQDPAAFIPLGQAVSAVVMRVRNSRLRVKIRVQTTEGTE